MVGCIGIFAYLGIPHPISSGLQDAVFQHWPWTLAVNLLLMNGWGMIPVASWNEPAWTLSVTFFLYVLFPNLILILRRIGTNRTLHCALIVALILGYWALRETVAQGGQSDGAGGLVRGLTFFLVGIAMARMEHLPNVRFGIPIFIVAALVWTYIYPFSMTLLHLTYPLLLISIIQTPRPLVPPKIANWMGEISFPLFISHYPVLLLIQHTMGNDLAALATQNGATKTLCYGLVIALCFLAAELLRRLDNRLHTHRRTRT
jgi:peptidoglycan/LPS O-acetylase OafA/YrhL